MKTKAIYLIGLMFLFNLMTAYGLEQNTAVDGYESIINTKDILDYEKIIKLSKLYENDVNSNIADKLLLEIGKIALKMEITNGEYDKNPNLKNICHMKIIKSENYGDFIGYDGYHFKKILNEYPKSSSVDDAEFYLIYVLGDEHNYTDLEEEKSKIESFMKKHPESNLFQDAKKRYDFLKDYLKDGGQSIVD